MLLSVPAWADVEKRVWFIMDNSGSMDNTDPGCLAKLSAHLFYGLLEPRVGMDSFRLSTLDAGSGPPRTPFEPSNAQALEDYLQNRVGNTAPHTYYYSAVQQAYDGLRNEKRWSLDHILRKVIVFVTDGEPEDMAQAASARDLARKLQEQDIQLHILLFGTKAANGYSKVAQMFPESSHIKIESDPKGDRLLFMVANVFGRAFGALVSMGGHGYSRRRL
jgi:hypothetical protein